MNGGANGSNTDEDMNDLFRSFLVDGEDLLAISAQGNSHPGGTQAMPPSDISPPAGFCLRVGVSGGGGGGGGVRVGGAGGGGYEADGGSGPMRRRANTSPDCEDVAPSSTQVRACAFEIWFHFSFLAFGCMCDFACMCSLFLRFRFCGLS